ncbi:glycoside hydrolase family 32 protein [Vibrio quintilis]|uniref:Sucrose-6-phosphate hydrolase n=1 Tax=Vibrio quintilis TaxID=1117707 RepID=A0A1M7YVW7_9VIBR|nr:sucrose-6-phosphate hydrolase [Vibrio quintilis]SHO56741.1 Sucrose-6-phosphate hydrolase [Vibrio quintilis]
MTPDELIAACGGRDNLRRALKVSETVIIELGDPSLRTEQVASLPFNPALSQITWKQEVPLTADEWQYFSDIIDESIRQQISALRVTEPACFRPQWHIAPVQGMLNDPNGFTFHQGEYHLFHGLYQFSGKHKDRCWVHYTSPDLVNWTSHPVALCTSDWFDSHGVYSGHAVSQQDELVIIYTGNVRIGEQRDRLSTQCLATSADGIHFTKHGPLIDELPPGVTPHFRDPKIFRHHDHWIMLLGAQEETPDGTLRARLALYRSKDLRDWQYCGLYGETLNDGHFGYMWECPDLFEADGQLFSMLCPQGITSHSQFYTIPHHCGYVKATLDAEDNLSLREFRHLDHGFDFYAPQTTQAADGRRLLIGWMGMPDETRRPSTQEGWLHQLTCIRELTYQNGQLYQQPARELQQLRGAEKIIRFSGVSSREVVSLTSKCFELQTRFRWPQQGQITLRLMDNGEYYCDLILDADNQRIMLDRSHALPQDGDTLREIPWPDKQDVSVQLLADNASLEIFINDGRYVMTSSVFTPTDACRVQFISSHPCTWQDVSCWSLRQHATDTKVILKSSA